MERGELHEAEKRLEDAVKLNKNDINHRRYYAEVLWQQGKRTESLQQLNEAVHRGGGENASLRQSLAEKYLTIQDFTAAYDHADTAVQLDSQNAKHWALRGKALRGQAEWTVQQQPESGEIIRTMLNQSREDFLRAVSLAPNDRELLPELALSQMRCRQPEQALATWLSVQNLYPHGGEPTEVLRGKAETLAVLNRLDEAAICVGEVRRREPNDPEAEQLLCRILAQQHAVRR